VNTLQQALSYAKAHRNEFLEELCEFVRIPSISADPEYAGDVRAAAEWLAEWIRNAGGSADLLESGGHPLVAGEIPARPGRAEATGSAPEGMPTLLVYGHYDVQPVDPRELWDSDPFEPVVREERLYGRGTSDMKAQVMAVLFAIRAATEAGELPVNVRFLLEGEEEIGSPSLPSIVEQNGDRFSADTCLNPDTGMFGPHQPTICYGLRGMAYFELRLRGPERDLHSGAFGGVVHNPAQVMTEVLASLHTPEGRVTIPGFYDRVSAITPRERERLARMPLDDAYVLAMSGVPTVWGEPEFTVAERLAARPTLEINGLVSGYTGPGPKTVIPAEAMAKISARLVPDQTPEEVREQLTAHLRDIVPPSVTWELAMLGAGGAFLSDPETGPHAAMANALKETWGVPPLLSRSGGSVPVADLLRSRLGMDSVLTGFALPDDRIHSPNESQHLPTWQQGIEAVVRFLFELAGGAR
jgi:acetylornithine deacetylase/succinyl-diaminopimelate desuccinylase-like protein